jgi:hypothetical protein
MNDPREAIFSKAEIASFYSQIIARYQTSEIEQPEKAGWRLTKELRGEDLDNVPSPVLFKVYVRGNDERMVITSGYLHKRQQEYVGATHIEEIDLFGPPGDEKTEQARKTRLWMGLIGRVLAAKVDPDTSTLRENEVDMICKMACFLIQKDLQTILVGPPRTSP